jgi:hypothetical protein
MTIHTREQEYFKDLKLLHVKAFSQIRASDL